VEAIDDSEAFLAKHPLDILENGLAHRVPWVTGVTSDEGLVSAACFYTRPETMGLYESNWDENTLRVLGMPPNAANGTEITKKLRDYYFPPGTGSGEHYKQRQYAKMFSDISFNLHMHHAASTQRRYSDVYLYHLSRRGGFSLQTLYLNLHRLNERSVPMKLVYTVAIFLETTFKHFLLGIPPADYGVAHAEDLPYLFWMPFVFKISRDEVGDINFSKDLVKLWASFAKNEELSFRGTPLTPINSTGPLQYIDLNDESKTINEPFQDRLQFLQTLRLLKRTS
jgi:carboxylesterase type B